MESVLAGTGEAIWLRAGLVLAAMSASGVLGAYCRVIWDRRIALTTYRDWFWPGIAAALVVPVFLSVGGNSIFTEALSVSVGVEMVQALFVIAGFCTLAGVSAPSFVNALAQKAFALAQEADRKAERAENLGEAANELAENRNTAVQDEPSEESQKRAEQITDSNQKLVYQTLTNSDYDWRSVGGIASATGMGRTEVREALAALKAKDFVTDKKSVRTGSMLYQAKL